MGRKVYLVVEGRMDVMSTVFFEISRGLDEELDTVTQESISAAKPFEEDPSAEDAGDYRQLLRLGEELQKTRVKAVVFAVMCLEAFIYDFASHHMGDAHARKRLDGMGLLKKWAVIPKSALGKGLPEDSQAFKHLKVLLKERNDLVHAKSLAMPATTGADAEFAKAVIAKIMPRTTKRLERQATCPKPHSVLVEVLTALSEIEYVEADKDKWWELTECPPRLRRFLSEIGMDNPGT